MAKVTIPKLTSSSFKGWVFVLVAGGLLALLALFDRGGAGLLPDQADGSTGCMLEVAADELYVRAGPSENAERIDSLSRGERVDATTVLTGGYRQLEDARWASDQYLTPLPGYRCS